MESPLFEKFGKNIIWGIFSLLKRRLPSQDKITEHHSSEPPVELV